MLVKYIAECTEQQRLQDAARSHPDPPECHAAPATRFQFAISPAFALLTNTSQAQQFTAVVYRADGTVDSTAQVTSLLAFATTLEG
jgi:hypothetical protein